MEIAQGEASPTDRRRALSQGSGHDIAAAKAGIIRRVSETIRLGIGGFRLGRLRSSLFIILLLIAGASRPLWAADIADHFPN
jgi:hypothetical protein